MAIFVGEGITIVCQATDPATDTAITTTPAAVEFFAPGKNPVSTPGDRTVDEGPFTMSFNPAVVNKDGTTGAYECFIDTTGWAPGKWTYRVTLTGAFASWEYATVTLKA